LPSSTATENTSLLISEADVNAVDPDLSFRYNQKWVRVGVGAFLVVVAVVFMAAVLTRSNPTILASPPAEPLTADVDAYRPEDLARHTPDLERKLAKAERRKHEPDHPGSDEEAAHDPFDPHGHRGRKSQAVEPAEEIKLNDQNKKRDDKHEHGHENDPDNDHAEVPSQAVEPQEADRRKQKKEAPHARNEHDEHEVRDEHDEHDNQGDRNEHSEHFEHIEHDTSALKRNAATDAASPANSMVQDAPPFGTVLSVTPIAAKEAVEPIEANRKKHEKEHDHSGTEKKSHSENDHTSAQTSQQPQQYGSQQNGGSNYMPASLPSGMPGGMPNIADLTHSSGNSYMPGAIPNIPDIMRNLPSMPNNVPSVPSNIPSIPNNVPYGAPPTNVPAEGPSIPNSQPVAQH